MFDHATDTDVRDDAHGGRSLVAVFATAESARETARQLHAHAFHHVWIGITHAGAATGNDAAASATASPDAMTRMEARASGAADTGTDDVVVESVDDSLGAKIGRFFSGESTTAYRSLYDELVRHGVDRTTAARVEGDIPPESAVLTVDGANHPEQAAQIVEAGNGHLVAGEAFGGFADETAAGAAGERRGSDVLGYRDPQRYARGREIDDERRIALRAERLDVAKQRESAGEATIGKDIVERRQELDVPTFREELFVERRSGGARTTNAASDAANDVRSDTETRPFGDAETIRIPLVRERVVVTKRPVVTDEYVVGKRQVAETQHVSETLREEKLRVDDATGIVDGDDVAADRSRDTNR